MIFITPCPFLLIFSLIIAIVSCVRKRKSKAVFLLSFALLIVITLYAIALIIDRDIFMLWVFFAMVIFEDLLNIK